MSFVINGEIIYKKECCTTETLRHRVHGTELWLNQFDMSGLLWLWTVHSNCSPLFCFARTGNSFSAPGCTDAYKSPGLYAENCTGRICYFRCNHHCYFCDYKVLELNDEQENAATNAVGKEKFELAYLLFTSGTTGYLKAVEICRKGLLNFVDAIPKCFNFPKTLKSPARQTLPSIFSFWKALWLFLTVWL